MEARYGEGYFTDGEYASYDASRSTHQLNFRRKLALLRRHGLPVGRDVRLLEIGSATGEFLRLAADESVGRALGLEVSEYGRRIARQRGLDSISPFDPAAAAQIAALRPNAIVAWDVWEHLEDPVGTVEGLLAHATPDVLVALTTVDASSLVARLRGRRWRQYHPPTHLHYPTRRSLEVFFRDRGFTIRYHRAFGYFRPLREYLRAVGVRCGGSAVWSLPIYLDLFDTQLLIASRDR